MRREMRIARPDLLAIDDPAAILAPHCAGFDRREVGTGIRLREALAPDVLHSQDPRNVVSLLVFRAHTQDNRSDEFAADGVDAFGRLGPSELFVDDEIVEMIEALPTILLRPRNAPRSPAA